MGDFILGHSTFFILTLFFLLVLSLFFVFRLSARVFTLEQNLKVFLSGKNGKSLESTLLAQTKKLHKLDGDFKTLYEFCEKIHAFSLKSIHKVGFVRFNPFGDVGGNQSFALSLLDSKKNGVVISSLYTKEGVRVYAKPIKAGSNLEKYPFTEEESHAVETASSQKSLQEK